jgi:transcriptional regulator with XRE-family HTH domain
MTKLIIWTSGGIYFMRISEIIRNCRKKENLTQEQVANYLNISTPAVKRQRLWEEYSYRQYTDRAKKLVEVFDLGEYRKYTLDLYLAKEKQDKEKAIEMVINMVNEADSMDNAMKSKLYKHRKWKVTNRWSREKYEGLVKETIKKDKTLDFIKNDPRIKSLLE